MKPQEHIQLYYWPLDWWVLLWSACFSTSWYQCYLAHTISCINSSTSAILIMGKPWQMYTSQMGPLAIFWLKVNQGFHIPWMDFYEYLIVFAIIVYIYMLLFGVTNSDFIIVKVQIVEIFPPGCQGTIYHAQSMSWFWITWWNKEAENQQWWCWPSYPKLFWFQPQ